MFKSPILPENISEELTNLIEKNGIISIDKSDIEFVINSYSSCKCHTFKEDEEKYTDIIKNINLEDAKYLILIIKQKGDLSLYKMSELINNISEKLKTTDILFGDYIDRNMDKDIEITTLTFK